MKNRSRVLLLSMLAAGGILSACSLLTEDWSGLTPLETEISTSNEKGYELMNEGNYEQAVIYFEQAIEYVYKLEPGLKELQQEIELTELVDSPFNNLSWARNELGDYEESLELINKSLLILPNTDTEYVNKGNALYGLNRNDEALAQYDKAIELNGLSESAYYGKGMIYYDEGKYDEAAGQMNTYLTFNPDDPDALETAIYSYLYLDEDDKAAGLADDYMQRNPEDFEAYRLKGDVLESTAEYAEIKAFYEQANERLPDLAEAQLELGELYYDYEKYEDAMAYFGELSAVHPDNMDIYQQ